MLVKLELTHDPITQGHPYSTETTVIELTVDPLYRKFEKVDVDGVNYEVRKKSFKVDMSGATPQTIVTYEMSKFGVKQPNGSIG